MSAPALSSRSSVPSSTPNLTVDSQSAAAAKPKPCCVCKEEKTARDECMLFSRGSDAQKECQSMVQKYRSCMKGFGFEIP